MSGLPDFLEAAVQGVAAFVFGGIVTVLALAVAVLVGWTLHAAVQTLGRLARRGTDDDPAITGGAEPPREGGGR